MINRKGRLEYHPERGVLYFFDGETGECLLRIQGVRNVPAGDQIDIHLVEPHTDSPKIPSDLDHGAIYALKMKGRSC